MVEKRAESAQVEKCAGRRGQQVEKRAESAFFRPGGGTPALLRPGGGTALLRPGGGTPALLRPGGGTALLRPGGGTPALLRPGGGGATPLGANLLFRPGRTWSSCSAHTNLPFRPGRPPTRRPGRARNVGGGEHCRRSSKFGRSSEFAGATNHTKAAGQGGGGLQHYRRSSKFGRSTQ